ncbi:hypothetical protein [Actinokineospora sp.]|uniref:hypothetical protein n=1 Tax=Actinokineospora sp. TaxID=1872133 RepID=UPI00403824FF
MGEPSVGQAHLWPGGLPCVRVRRIGRALDFYLAIGFDVQITADGWVLLRADAVRLVLAHAPNGAPPVPVLRLWTADLAGLCERLRALSVPVGPLTYSAQSPGGRVVVSDPDGNTVLIRALDHANGRASSPVPVRRASLAGRG